MTAHSAPDRDPSAPARLAHQVGEAVSEAGDRVGEVAAAIKPKLRGWIHAGVEPFVIAASIVLVVIAPPVAPRVAVSVFGLSAILLFGTSAVYHRGTWSPRVAAVLRRLDHTNIFLIIAGTYTPLAVLLLDEPVARTLLIIVWSGAIVGLLMRIFWLGAPRWLYVPIYLALGWVAVAYLGPLGATGGPAVVWLIMAGGLAYTVGAVIYGTKRPNPSPAWFGFHEIFHALTVVGYTCHLIAVFLVTVAAR
ncbi:MAG: hemolysin III family protein [Actinomycetales bacterium]|nr:hemolysin III family protein [Actinomycetales bacterium]